MIKQVVIIGGSSPETWPNMKKFDNYEVENSIQSEIDLLQLIINKPNN